jgi:mono/diheme cytochrome c family protein
MSVCGVRLGFGSLALALALASPAGAQGNLDQGKTGAQLFASGCAGCHKSAQSVSNTKWFFGLESYLRQHYTSSSESAAILAAYLKGQGKASAQSQRNRGTRHVTEVAPSAPTPGTIEEDIPRPPADIPDVKR